MDRGWLVFWLVYVAAYFWYRAWVTTWDHVDSWPEDS